jgi:glycosyltransferase involved in cell wall biosynthesis
MRWVAAPTETGPLAGSPPPAGSAEAPARLTVITSTYNQEMYVASAIDSVLAQRTTFPIHLIVTDDASSDSTLEIVERYRARHPDLISVLRSETHQWYFAVVLRALALAKTDYFCLLDGDDYWVDEHFLQRGFDFLEEHPEFVIYGTNCFREYQDGRRDLFIPEDAPDGDFSFDDYLHNRAVISQTAGTIFRNVLFKTEIPRAFEEMVGTRAQYSFACDFDRYAFHIHEGKARFENRPTSVYRITGEGLSEVSPFERGYWEATAKIDHWRYFDGEHPEFFLREALEWSKVCLEAMIETANTLASDPHIKPEDVADVWRVVNECVSHRDQLLDADVPSQAAWWKASQVAEGDQEVETLTAQLAEAHANLARIENSRRYRLACAVAAPLDRLRRRRS